MSNLAKIAIIAVGVGAGYFIEPIVFPRSAEKPNSGEDASTEKTPLADNEAATTPSSNQPQIDLDLSKLQPSDFPEKITIYSDITINDPVSGVKMDLKKGTLVKPVSINGQNIVVQPINIPLNGEIPADSTNFKQLALPKLLARLQGGAPAPATAEVIPKVETPIETAPPATPVETVTEAVVETAPIVNTDPITDEEILTLMKAQVTAGEIKEFTIDQVTDWQIGPPVEVDGKTYQQSGRVVFTAETIIGKQTHGAIAAINNGKIEKWFWAKNMLEMR